MECVGGGCEGQGSLEPSSLEWGLARAHTAASIQRMAGERYVAMDFEQGDVCYALKQHNPPPPHYCKRCAPAEVKAEVLASPRLLRAMKEVGRARYTVARHVTENLLRGNNSTSENKMFTRPIEILH